MLVKMIKSYFVQIKELGKKNKEDYLQLYFKDGKLIKKTTLEEIRNKLNNKI